MGNASISEVTEVKEGGGLKSILGIVNLSSSYATNGDIMDLSDYFLPASTPVVIINPTIDGYAMIHNLDSAATGKVKAMSGLSTEAVNGHDMSAQEAYFSATGPVY